MYIIAQAKWMLANETSGPHFAAALNVDNIFVISNGNHFGRFTPYPTKVNKNYHVIYPPKIESCLNNHEELINKYGAGSKLNINDISTNSVIEKINQVYHNKSL